MTVQAKQILCVTEQLWVRGVIKALEFNFLQVNKYITGATTWTGIDQK